MPSTITITLDAQGNVMVGDLPPGVFHSIFATPPDAQIRDVISINAADVYTLVIDAPTITGASAEDPDGIFTSVSWTSTRAIFSVNACQLPGGTSTQAISSDDPCQLPMEQEFGMATCQLGPSAVFQLGVLVNPASVSLPIGIDIQGTIIVDQDDVPVGVHCVPAQQKVSVWAAGGYSFAFSLPAATEYRIKEVKFEDPSTTFSHEISGDGLTAWIFNNNLATNPGVKVSFQFICSIATSDVTMVIIDPTIINNPINQGGDGLPGHPKPREWRYELAGTSA